MEKDNSYIEGILTKYVYQNKIIENKVLDLLSLKSSKACFDEIISFRFNGVDYDEKEDLTFLPSGEFILKNDSFIGDTVIIYGLGIYKIKSSQINLQYYLVYEDEEELSADLQQLNLTLSDDKKSLIKDNGDIYYRNLINYK